MKNSSSVISTDNNIAKLPFKGCKPEFKTKTVEDGFGLSIDIPTRGYASVSEYNAVMEVFTRYSSVDGTIDFSRVKSFESDVIEIMLKSRLNINKVDLSVSGEDIGAPMLKALFNFFSKELGLNINLPLGNFESNLEEVQL